MSGLGRRFDPSEFRPGAGPGPSDAELAQAMVAARELEALSARDTAGPTVGFEDRVMAAIAGEPAPRLLARPGRAIRGGLLGAFVLSVRDAWRIAAGGGRPLAIRAQAMAFVLLVILATGSLSVFAAVGASSLLTSQPSPTPSLQRPTEAPAALPAERPNLLDAPTPTPSPSADDEETAAPTQHSGLGPTAPTDEVGSGGTTEPRDTAKPTKTPEPTGTEEPDETDEPDETEEPSETPEGTGDEGGDSSGHGGD